MHGISRLRLAESPDRDPTATDDWNYYQGDALFDGWGLGPNAASLAFRCADMGPMVLSVTRAMNECMYRCSVSLQNPQCACAARICGIFFDSRLLRLLQ